MSGEKIKENGRVTRRDALHRALVLAGALTFPRNALAGGETPEAAFLNNLALVSHEMRSPRFRRMLASGSATDVRRIVAYNTIRLPSISELKDSPLNPEALFKYPILLGSRVDEKNQRHLSLIGAGEAGKQVHDLAETANRGVSHGNATAIATQVVITAAHLKPLLSNLPEVTMLASEQIDMAVALIRGTEFSEEQMVSMPSGIRDVDVHGRFVVIPGIDPDATARERGMYKFYDGLAFQMTPAMVQAFVTVNKDDAESPLFWHLAHQSLCVVIPEGEAFPHSGATKGSRASGMSGSPVFMIRNGIYTFVGVFWGVTSFSVEGKQHSLGMFLGPDTIAQLSSQLSLQRKKKRR